MEQRKLLLQSSMLYRCNRLHIILLQHVQLCVTGCEIRFGQGQVMARSQALWSLHSFWICVHLEAGNHAVCGRNAPCELLLQLMQLRLCGCGLPPCRGLIMAQCLVLILQRFTNDCQRGYLALQLPNPA